MDNPLFEVQEACRQLKLSEEEEQIFELGEVEEGENLESSVDPKYCMIGLFFTENRIPYEIMRDTLSNLWKPGKGVCIKKERNNRFSFQFFHELDIKRIVDGGPWAFKNHLLVWRKWEKGMDVGTVELNSTAFWIQVNDLPAGFWTERMCKDVGNFIGEYEFGDPRNFEGGARQFLRVRAQVSIRKPLKRFMKLRKAGGEWFLVNFKYEKLPTFCFICGTLGHGEMLCPQQYENCERNYGLWLRANARNNQTVTMNKWLKNEKGEKEEGYGFSGEGAASRKGGEKGKEKAQERPMETCIENEAHVHGESATAAKRDERISLGKGETSIDVSTTAINKDVADLEAGLMLAGTKRRVQDNASKKGCGPISRNEGAAGSALQTRPDQ